MKLSCSFSESRAVGAGGRARERQVYRDSVRVGWGASLRSCNSEHPHFQAVILVEQNCRSGCLKEVGTEGGQGWGQQAFLNPTSVVQLSLLSRYEVSRHSYTSPSAFWSWAQSDGEKEVAARYLTSQHTHLLCAVNPRLVYTLQASQIKHIINYVGVAIIKRHHKSEVNKKTLLLLYLPREF